MAFAFDPARTAVLLVAGDKSGISERAFYRKLIADAELRFGAHLARIRSSTKPKPEKVKRKK